FEHKIFSVVLKSIPARLAQHVGYTMPQLLTTQTVKIIFNNDIFVTHTHNATKIEKFVKTTDFCVTICSKYRSTFASSNNKN
ncbi:MAG: hypothetical protein ACFN01_07810, partial [Capnocytophaga leadbetteri]